MKTTLRLFAALLVANLAIYACTSQDEQSVPKGETIAEESGVTDIMDIPVEKLTCHTGGPGKAECKIEPGIKIGDFVSGGCSVSCYDGYYACCGIRCICKPDKAD